MTPTTVAVNLARVFALLVIGLGLFVGVVMPWAAAEDQETECGSGVPDGCDDLGWMVGLGVGVVAAGVWILFAAHATARGRQWARWALSATFTLWAAAFLVVLLREGDAGRGQLSLLLALTLAVAVLASWPRGQRADDSP